MIQENQAGVAFDYPSGDLPTDLLGLRRHDQPRYFLLEGMSTGSPDGDGSRTVMPLSSMIRTPNGDP
jgi:hypothetical protein